HYAVADLLHDFEDWQDRPRAACEFDARSFRQTSGNVFQYATAGDVGESFDLSRTEQAFEGPQVTHMRFQKRRADSFTEFVQISVRAVAGYFKKEFPRQRVTVCVQPNRRQPQHDIARSDRGS